MPTLADLWKTASPKGRVLLAAGALIIVTGVVWDVDTALRHHIGFTAFLAICADNLVRTVGIIAMSRWAAHGWGSRIRQRRRQRGWKTEAISGIEGECVDG